MKIRGRVLEPTAILTALLTACIYPTDKGDELRIDVAPIARMIRGDSLRVDARLLGADGTPIPNARFVYSSADNRVAVVTTDGLVIAVNAGTTNITVRAMGTQGTPAAQARVAVSGTVSVDSLRPLTAKWGQVLSLYGTGLGPGGDQLVTIDGVSVSIASYQPDDPVHPERFGVLRLLAAPPLLPAAVAKDVSVVVSTPRGAAALVTPLLIEPVDIFEPNTLTPGDLGSISGVREFPGLAMEAAALGPSDIDWYRFTTTAPGDWTIEVRVDPSVAASASVNLTVFPAGGVEAESLENPGWYYPTFIAYYPGRGSSAGQSILCRGRGAWFENYFGLGTSSHAISGFGQSSYSGPTITLRNLPVGRHDLLVYWANSVLYGADYRDGFFRNLRANQWAAAFEGGWYVTPPERYDLVFRPGVDGGPVFGDRFEPNDFCEDAKPLVTLGPTAFADSVGLTFDGVLDHDWFTIAVQTAGTLYAEFRFDGSLTGALVSADSDSAVAAGLFGLSSSCADVGPNRLTRIATDGCVIDGAPVQPGLYYLIAMPYPPGPTAYQLALSWAPAAASAGPLSRRGRP